MREIINGDVYDTEESKLIASHDCPSQACNELRYWEEDLYLTPDRRWFLHGAGGPLTLWAEIDQEGNQTSGSRIQPLTPQQASRWLQDAGETERWRRYFLRQKADQ